MSFKFNSNILEYFYSIFINKETEISSNETELEVFSEAYQDKMEFTKKRLIWARKSGTILLASNVEKSIKEKILINFDISDYSNEKTFKVSLFDDNLTMFEKFSSTKSRSDLSEHSIPIHQVRD